MDHMPDPATVYSAITKPDVSPDITRDKAVYAYLTDHPRSTQKEIGSAIGVSTTTVGRALKEIGEDNLYVEQEFLKPNRYSLRTSPSTDQANI